MSHLYVQQAGEGEWQGLMTLGGGRHCLHVHVLPLKGKHISAVLHKMFKSHLKSFRPCFHILVLLYLGVSLSCRKNPKGFLVLTILQVEKIGMM